MQAATTSSSTHVFHIKNLFRLIWSLALIWPRAKPVPYHTRVKHYKHSYNRYQSLLQHHSMHWLSRRLPWPRPPTSPDHAHRPYLTPWLKLFALCVNEKNGKNICGKVLTLHIQVCFKAAAHWCEHNWTKLQLSLTEMFVKYEEPLQVSSICK